MDATLLVELLTEELPPKSLKDLSEAFGAALRASLAKERFLCDHSALRVYATPRRIAATIAAIRERSPDTEREIQGPAVGAPSAAVAGFARKNGVAVEALQRARSAKGEVYVAVVNEAGKTLDAVLAEAVDGAVKALPIPKVMRWGAGDAQFVRPAHGLVMMHGTRVVAGRVLGIESGNRTRGHRFMGAGEIVLAGADEYETRLAADGMVVADFAARRAEIERQLAREAARHGATLGDYHGLLDEVTALVEHPSVYAGQFDAAHLEVPTECLVLTMRQNQKYFPLFDSAGMLLPRFLIVSNMRLADPRHVIGGNERVVRPRLEDARFFYDQDRRKRLEERVPQLAKVVYHHKLGSQLERVERLQLLAGAIARAIGADATLAARAAWLSKADLLTAMVGEFPELQGVMGRYYARHDGEPAPVCEAIGAQYRVRFEDREPPDLVSAALYLAERIDALVGFFGIGQAPTGEKDPFGLRRAALGLIGAFEVVGAARKRSSAPPPDIRAFLALAAAHFPAGALAAGAVDQVYEFILERYWHQLAALYPKTSVESVISKKPRLDEVVTRVRAVEDFRRLPEAESLAAANKRIRNILRKSDPSDGALSEALLQEPAERLLWESVQRAEGDVRRRIEHADYAGALHALAALRAPVDSFFDQVLVNAEDARLRANRHALLRRLDGLMNEVADISRLAA